MHTNNKMATKNDVYDVVLVYSSYLYASGEFLVVEILKLDLDATGFTTCCVVEMTWVNMPDSAGLRLWRPWCTQKNEAP